ncbi:MAG: hypothetical protein V4572_05920 [Bacteroidota bacterium]
MKKLVLLFLLFSLPAVHAQQNDNSLVGKWVGEDKSKVVVVEFSENKTATVLLMGNPIPINEYKVDDSKNPIWVDFIISNSGQTMTLFGLVEFIDPKTIKWEVFPMGSERQTTFTLKKDSSTTILTKR